MTDRSSIALWAVGILCAAVIALVGIIVTKFNTMEDRDARHGVEIAEIRGYFDCLTKHIEFAEDCKNGNDD